MRMCREHWDRLGDAIEARGLSSLVAETPEEGERKMIDQLHGEITLDNFDPMLNAMHAIVSNAIERATPAGVQYLVTHDCCPLCTLNIWHEGHVKRCEDCAREHPDFTFDMWIDAAADEMVGIWQSFKL